MISWDSNVRFDPLGAILKCGQARMEVNAAQPNWFLMRGWQSAIDPPQPGSRFPIFHDTVTSPRNGASWDMEQGRVLMRNIRGMVVFLLVVVIAAAVLTYFYAVKSERSQPPATPPAATSPAPATQGQPN
jgi:hypothetical protein